MKQPIFDHRPYGITPHQLDNYRMAYSIFRYNPLDIFLNGSVRYRTNSEDCGISPAMLIVKLYVNISNKLCVNLYHFTIRYCNSRYMFGTEVIRYPLNECER